MKGITVERCQKLEADELIERTRRKLELLWHALTPEFGSGLGEAEGARYLLEDCCDYLDMLAAQRGG